MRLLEVNFLRLEEFAPYEIPPYAILSHTWGLEEVTFQDFQNGLAESKAGFSKIKNACAQSAKDGYSYIWIDACCIDKTSSAELSEAINSMFQWYMHAKVCYTYLVDVSPDDKLYDNGSQFRKSRWFTRGWTLQELIAPSEVIFFSHDWNRLKRKSEIADLLHDITRISPLVLGGSSIQDFSIAQRMSWASGRNTTRPEDIAYCLMGLFNVNMPLLYGEGRDAFMRLQYEIIKSSDDQTLYAWRRSNTPADYFRTESFLAISPDEFSEAGNLFPIPPLQDRISIPSEITNKGLRVGLVLIRSASFGMTNFAVPVARDKMWDLGCCHSIILKRFPGTIDQFVRDRPFSLDTSIKLGSSPNTFVIDGLPIPIIDGLPTSILDHTKTESFYTPVFIRTESVFDYYRSWCPTLSVPVVSTNSPRIELRDVYPPTACDAKDRIINIVRRVNVHISNGNSKSAVLRYCHGPSSAPGFVKENGLIIVLGFKYHIGGDGLTDFEPWCKFLEPVQGEYPSLMDIYHLAKWDKQFDDDESLKESTELPVKYNLKCLETDYYRNVRMQLLKIDESRLSYELKLSVF